MIEHWYDYLPAAWFTPQGKWIMLLCVILIFIFGFICGFIFHILKTNRWLHKNSINPRELKD